MTVTATFRSRRFLAIFSMLLGLVVAGRPVDTAPTLTETGKLLFTIPSPETVNHFSLFLTEPLAETGSVVRLISRISFFTERRESQCHSLNLLHVLCQSHSLHLARRWRINICWMAQPGQPRGARMVACGVSLKRQAVSHVPARAPLTVCCPLVCQLWIIGRLCCMYDAFDEYTWFHVPIHVHHPHIINDR